MPIEVEHSYIVELLMWTLQRLRILKYNAYARSSHTVAPHSKQFNHVSELRLPRGPSVAHATHVCAAHVCMRDIETILPQTRYSRMLGIYNYNTRNVNAELGSWGYLRSGEIHTVIYCCSLLLTALHAHARLIICL